MMQVNLADLPAWDPELGALNVIIETAKGNHNKYKYEPDTGTFQLHKVLPSGMVFPYDFGFVPSTVGDDGDPLDVLLLMDEPAFTGCRVPSRLVGVIEAEQIADGKSERNDRLLAVAECSHNHKAVKTLKDVSDHLLEEIEHFFAAYHDLDGKEFKPIGRRGPNRAAKLVKEGVQRFKASAAFEPSSANGRAHTAAK